MRPIGFSTGALARGDFRRALTWLNDFDTKALELSALRDHELAPLMAAINDLDLARFEYVSVHVPSKFQSMSEAAVAGALERCIDLKLPIVLHPDIVQDPARWTVFGSLLCIENMDKRKKSGRTLEELNSVFEQFPKATFCLDMAHARQIDSTMTEARLMLRRFGDRLRQVHMSELDAAGHHEALSYASVLSGQTIAGLIPQNVPIIVESMVQADDIARELSAVARALSMPSQDAGNSQARDWGELA